MHRPVPVIIDTDPGVDDALALLLAAASPEIEVRAITTVAGNVPLARATENARRIVPVAWPERPPPLYRGGAGGTETAEAVHGDDGLGGSSLLRNADDLPLYPPAATLAGGDAAGALLDLARRRPGEVTLITLGPLTNLALAIGRDPDAARLLRRAVIMGGAFREPGNTGPVAEFNIFVDPEAAQAVCESGLPLTWVPLDVTHRCLLRAEDLEGLPGTRRGNFVRDIVRFYMDYHARGYGEQACFLHDPLAVGVVLWPELVRTESKRVDVELQGGRTRGMTVADFRPAVYRAPQAPNAEICLEVDAGEFLKRFVERVATEDRPA
jgi:inosine-uridine nucleoside N-ribohydrolase